MRFRLHDTGFAGPMGLPLLTMVLFKSNLGSLAAFVPTGNVYIALTEGPMLSWYAGLFLAGTATLVLTAQQLRSCDSQLRRWYDLHHGQKSADS